MNNNNHFVRGFVLVLAMATQLSAEQVVVPVSPTGSDSAFGGGTLANPGFRVQQVYAAGLFPTGALVITELRMRPDFFYGKVFSTTISSIQIRISTTARAPENLSATYANNIGTDETVVLNGAVTVASAFSGPPAGPKAFDINLPLSTPFLYMPGTGNLLVDILNHSGSSASLVGGQGIFGDGASRVAGGIGASTGTVDVGADVFQFVFSDGSTTTNPPTILIQPIDKTVLVGTSVSFSVQATGAAPLEYQWRLNEEALAGATNSILTLTNVAVSQAGSYSVVVSNAFGTAVSSNAALTINPPPTPGTFDLSRDFSLVDNPNGAWSYGYKTALNGTFAPNLVRQTGVTDAGVPMDLWGFQPYTLPAVYFNASSQTAVTHGGQGIYPPGTVFFLAGNDGTEQNFGAIRLVIPAGGDGEYRVESAVRTYLNGLTSGDTDYHVVKNGLEVFGQFMPPSSSSGYSNSLSLAAGDTLDFLVGRGQDGHLYGSGLIIDARLYMLTSGPAPARILVQPQSKTVFAGANVSFSVEATGTAPLDYQWRFDGEAISGSTNAALMLGNVALSQAGSYSVVVSNALGTAVSSNAALTVNTPPTAGTFDLSRDFSLVDNPNGVWSYGYKTALDGTFAPNLVRQTGITPAGVPLDLWGFQPYTLPAVYFNASSQTAVTQGGEGVYPPGTVFFLAGNDGTEQNFGAIRLVIPAGGDGEYRMESAVRTYLNGRTSGDTDYHFVKNGVEVFGQFMPPSSSSGYSNSLSLAAGDILDFLVGRGQDGHLYGSGLTIDARLYMLTSGPAPARILIQPRSKTVFAGANVNFSVEATGTAPLDYQWRFDGEAISGATNAALMLGNVALSQAGNYSVVVSNAFGMAVSSNAALTVNTPPTPGTFDLSRDFSLVDNPNGVWSYGYKTALDGTFAPNLVRQTGITPAGVPLDLWGFQPYTLPAVYFNASSQTAVTQGGEGNYPPGTVFFLAGNDGTEQNFGAIRLVIPAGGDGEYRLESAVRTYLNGPTSGDTDYHVVKNGVEVFGQFMPPSSSSGYSNSLSLAAGDILDFLVGRGQDRQLYGSGLIIDSRLFFQGTASAPPSILVQPRGREVVVGADLTLSVVANGTAPYHFQWRKSSADLPDATNTTFVLYHVASTDAGDYSVVVQNDFGSVTSHVATLVVNPGPAVLRIVSATAGTDGEVQIPIEMAANGNENAIGFSLRFDPAILHLVSVAAGTSAQDASLLVNSDQAGSGHVGIALALPSGNAFAEGTQQLVRVTLSVVQTTNRIDSSIRFGDQPLSRQVADAQAHSLNASFVDGTVLIDGTGSTNGIGFEGDVIPRPGGNGVIGINDWVQLGRFVAGLDTITNQQEFQRADCAPRPSRGDGAITVSDWVQAGRYAIGLDLLGPTGGPSEPQALGGFSPAAGPATARRLSLPASAVLPGATLSLPVRFESQGNENALSFSLSFDPTKLQFVGVAKLSKAYSALLNVNTNQANTGKVGLALALPAGTAMAANGDDFIMLNFAVRAEATGIVPVTFGSQPVLREVSDVAANPVPNLYSDGAVTIGNPFSGPPVSIFQSGGNVILAWPSSALGFELHSSTNLAVGSWSRVSITPIELGGQRIVSLPISGYQRYFRLVKP